MTTLRQILANQKNALKSTGPTTEAGKAIARRNALKHGMGGSGFVLPEFEILAIEQRFKEWHSALKPWDQLEEWLAGQIATASVQIERCQWYESMLRAEYAERVEDCWEDDRRLAAEVLALGLSRRPAMVSRQLRQTAQGCDWLIERWEALGKILEHKSEWSEAQRSLALDLLGTPIELRDGPTPIDAESGRAEVVTAELAKLRKHRETTLARNDERDRVAAEMGIELEVPHAIKLIRRYEAAAERRMRWAREQMRRGGRLAPELPKAELKPEPQPEPEPEPEDDDPLDELDDLSKGLSAKQRAELQSMPMPDPVSDWLARLPQYDNKLTGALAPAPGNRRDRRAQQSRDRRA